MAGRFFAATPRSKGFCWRNILLALFVVLALAWGLACRADKPTVPGADRSAGQVKPAAQAAAKAASAKPRLPDPEQLLEKDLAAGVLTVDQASRYRVLRLFRPEEVPERYRYRKPPTSGTWDLLQVFNRFAELSPETAKELEPYFLRPDDPRSVFHDLMAGPGPVASSSPSVTAAPSSRGSEGFRLVPAAFASDPAQGYEVRDVYLTETGTTVEVIGDRSRADAVHKARRLIEENKIYERFERLLGRKTFAAENRTFEVYILGHIRPMRDEQNQPFEPWGFFDPSLISPRFPSKATGWIVISAGQTARDPRLASTLAHEFFHAFQFAFSSEEDMWLVEGSATWSEDFIGRDWNTEQDRLNSETFDIVKNAHNPLTANDSSTAYGMYLFFYYLTRVRSGGGDAVMRGIWEACEAVPATSLASVTKAAGGDFKGLFKEYALATLDIGESRGKFPDVVDRYDGQTPLPLMDSHFIAGLARIDEEGRISREGGIHLTGMCINYCQVDNAAMGPAAPAVRFDLSEFNGREELAIQAVIEYSDGRIVDEDWSELEERVFCLSHQAQNFVAIYLALSYALEDPAGKDFKLDLSPAPDAECTVGEMRVTVSSRTDEDYERTKREYGDNDTKTMKTLEDREATFLLGLVPATPVTETEAESYIDSLSLPAEIRKTAKAHVLAGRPELDEDSGCLVYRFRVKSCRVSSFRRTRVLSGLELESDSWGTSWERRHEDREAWAATGLSNETEKWLKDESLSVDVYFDPESDRIEWVYLRGPVEVKIRGTLSFQQAGRKRVKYDPVTYEDISRSSSETREDHTGVQVVSRDIKGTPLNPDWRARNSTPESASGGGRVERPLDRQISGDHNEKTVIKGSEVKTIEWRLALSSNPRR